VDTGVYAIVRHPQYTGGIYSIFLTTFLWYPHWLFGVLGAAGTAVIYISCREEDRELVRKFGRGLRGLHGAGARDELRPGTGEGDQAQALN